MVSAQENVNGEDINRFFEDFLLLGKAVTMITQARFDGLPDAKPHASCRRPCAKLLAVAAAVPCAECRLCCGLCCCLFCCPVASLHAVVACGVCASTPYAQFPCPSIPCASMPCASIPGAGIPMCLKPLCLSYNAVHASRALYKHGMCCAMYEAVS